MTQAYSDPARESDPHALPDVEVFYMAQPTTVYSARIIAELGDGQLQPDAVDALMANYNRENADHGDDFTIYDAGWYWWPCFPGCMPDGDPSGPFDSEAEALADAQDTD